MVFIWPNLCALDLYVFIVLVGRNLVPGICKLKLKNFMNGVDACPGPEMFEHA